MSAESVTTRGRSAGLLEPAAARPDVEQTLELLDQPQAKILRYRHRFLLLDSRAGEKLAPVRYAVNRGSMMRRRGRFVAAWWWTTVTAEFVAALVRSGPLIVTRTRYSRARGKCCFP
jgi:hypothetical protein